MFCSSVHHSYSVNCSVLGGDGETKLVWALYLQQRQCLTVERHGKKKTTHSTILRGNLVKVNFFFPYLFLFLLFDCYVIYFSVHLTLWFPSVGSVMPEGSFLYNLINNSVLILSKYPLCDLLTILCMVTLWPFVYYRASTGIATTLALWEQQPNRETSLLCYIPSLNYRK